VGPCQLLGRSRLPLIGLRPRQLFVTAGGAGIIGCHRQEQLEIERAHPPVAVYTRMDQRLTMD
jgi:hypothetical protein